MTILKTENTTTASKRSLSNILKIFFVLLHIIFGYDFGFLKYRSSAHKTIIAILNIVLGFIFFLLAQPDFAFMIKIWYFVLFSTRCSYILTLLLTPEQNTFQTFMNHLLWIDSELEVENSQYRFEFIIVLSCTLSILLEIFLGTNSSQGFSLYRYILHFFVFASIRIPFLVLFFVFRATNGRLAALKNLVNSEPKKAQILYKSLIDSVENVKKSFNYIFLVTMLANIFSTMAAIYMTVTDLKTMGIEQLYNNSPNIIAAVMFLSTLFVPALAAGTLPNEVKRLTIVLQDLLVLESDESRLEDIERFIRYIEARPFKLTVLRIIPLDASFVVMSLKFTVT